MFRDNVEENLARVLIFPENSLLSVWALFVRHDHNIQINARLSGFADEFRPESFLNFLHENLNLFHILAEEDPEYQRIRIL